MTTTTASSQEGSRHRILLGDVKLDDVLESVEYFLDILVCFGDEIILGLLGSNAEESAVLLIDTQSLDRFFR